ncbi:MAG: hypothetical protein ACYDBT_00380 [Desulfobulbaceae bacterium]
MTSIEFLRPRLCGKRFEGRAIPLEVLKDLAVLEEMVVEVAKWRFLQEHTDRQRSPRGFADGIELKLTGVEEGSTIPVISLIVASLNLPGIPPTNQVYFEQAREAIVYAIEAAERNQSVNPYLPDKCLSYFDRLGRSLRDEESIEFTTPSHPAPARLTKETRRKLILASALVRELTEEVTIRGVIPEADQDKMTFELQLLDDHKITGPIPDQHFDTIIEAFNGYRRGTRILLQGIGRYNRQNRLLGLESIEHISLLDLLDVSARLDELRSLRDGWLDGKGLAPNSNGLDWLSASFDRHYPDELPLPYIYPTAEGGIQAEWSLGSNEISIEVDLATHQGEWHWLDLLTDATDSRELNLDNDDTWLWFVSEIRRLTGGAA